MSLAARKKALFSAMETTREELDRQRDKKTRRSRREILAGAYRQAVLRQLMEFERQRIVTTARASLRDLRPDPDFGRIEQHRVVAALATADLALRTDAQGRLGVVAIRDPAAGVQHPEIDPVPLAEIAPGTTVAAIEQSWETGGAGSDPQRSAVRQRTI